MIQTRNLFAPETWTDFCINTVISSFLRCTDVSKYNILYAKRELQKTCYQLQIVLNDTNLYLSVTYVEINNLTTRHEAILQYIHKKIEEIANEEKIKCIQRGIQVEFDTETFFRKLAIGDQQLVNEMRLLIERVSSLREHANKLEVLKRTFFMYFEQCAKQYNSVQLTSHIANVGKVVNGLQLETLGPLAKDLKKEMESIKLKMDEMSRKMSSYDKMEEQAFRRFGNTSKNVDDIMHEILSTSSSLKKVSAEVLLS